MRFRLQNLLILTAIAAAYSVVIVWVGRAAIWDGLDYYRGSPHLLALGAVGWTALLIARPYLWSGRPGKALFRFEPPWKRWKHTAPAIVAAILAVWSVSNSMRFPVWFAVSLFGLHVVTEQSTEIVVREKGIVCDRGLYAFRYYYFWVKQDVHTAYLMRRVRGERPRRRLCRVLLSDAQELRATLDSVQPPAEPGDELFSKKGPFDLPD